MSYCIFNKVVHVKEKQVNTAPNDKKTHIYSIFFSAAFFCACIPEARSLPLKPIITIDVAIRWEIWNCDGT